VSVREGKEEEKVRNREEKAILNNRGKKNREKD
jgi:hypothetical protein